MSTKRLLEIKNQIDEAKSKQSEITGQIKSIKEQMKQKFKISDLNEAEKLLEKMGIELDAQETEFEKGMEKLEEAYNWGDIDQMGFHVKDMLKTQQKNAKRL